MGNCIPSSIDISNMVKAPQVVQLMDKSHFVESKDSQSHFLRIFSRHIINSEKSDDTSCSTSFESEELLQKEGNGIEFGCPSPSKISSILNNRGLPESFKKTDLTILGRVSKTQEHLSLATDFVKNMKLKLSGNKSKCFSNEDSGMESYSPNSSSNTIYLCYDHSKIRSNESSFPSCMDDVTARCTKSEVDITPIKKEQFVQDRLIINTTHIPSTIGELSTQKCNYKISTETEKKQGNVIPFYEECLYEKKRSKVTEEMMDSSSDYSQSFSSRPFVAVAKATYARKYAHELSVSEGERLLVLNHISIPNESAEQKVYLGAYSSELWLVERIELQHMFNQGSRKGLVPGRYLEKISNSPTTHISWSDIDRAEADRLLLLMGNPSGTYILRPSSDSDNTYALSIRYLDQSTLLWSVKHYRIRLRLADETYYIFRRISFPTIDQLLAHYTVSADGIACCLTIPYPKIYEPPSNLSLLEVNRNNFTLNKKLGQGSFGEVWQATWNNRMSVAVKKLLGNGNMDRVLFLNEAELMHRLNHPHVVQLLAVCTMPEEQPTYLVTELMENGSLKQYMQKLDPKKNTLKNLLSMMKDVAMGMMYLEEQHYVHRDLRSSNVLVDSNYKLKVADFGLAHLLNDSDEYVGTLLTKFPVRWTAPEGILKQAYSIKSDIWSFGVLIYEILTFCELPYKELSAQEVRTRVCSGYRLPRPEMKIPVAKPLLAADDHYEVPKLRNTNNFMCPIGLYNKILECWNILPEKRPSFNSLHCFIDEMLSKESEANF
uniref:Tyrosine-protein kinase n=1 Tax=Trichobilharzia regenti TaxID=157069 RepID=A0AA85K6Y7_TRIRE|nr:unnamed protein product [Trichobilharzia regenti]